MTNRARSAAEVHRRRAVVKVRTVDDDVRAAGGRAVVRADARNHRRRGTAVVGAAERPQSDRAEVYEHVGAGRAPIEIVDVPLNGQ